VTATYREFGRFEPFLRGAVAVVCVYEAVAITTRRVPTVSCLTRRYPILGDVVLTALARHFEFDPNTPAAAVVAAIEETAS